LTVTTRKGQHHYFKRTQGTFAKSDSHNTGNYPERIDVKAGRGFVVLPPSTGKDVDIDEAENVAELTEATQEFIDAVFIHNGRQAPRPPAEKTPCPLPLPADMDHTTARISAMLAHVDPGSGYDNWLHGLMAIYHETGGSEDGLALANAWSSKGHKYNGEEEIRTKWDSFGSHTGTPVTIGTVIKMLEEKGIDWIDVCDAVEPQFTQCEYTVSPPNEQPLVVPSSPGHSLARYSLTGKLHLLEKESVEQVLILGDLALMGQITVFYAAPNTGKTLLTLWLLIQAIKSGNIDPSKIYYINVDDSLSGLIMKLRLAEKYGFHMLAEGHSDFRADDLVGILSKRESTDFCKVIRRFVMQGGTCIELAHVNKNPGRDGRPVYAGTTDIIEDVDCAYTLQVISDPEAHEKVVEFNNIKRRGDVCQQAAYRYSTQRNLHYIELLQSIEPVEDEELLPLHQAEEARSDAESINTITQCIQEGINTKMDLAAEAAKRTGISRRATIAVIEKYTGTDSAAHQWTFDVGERGAKVYHLLDPGTSPDSAEDTVSLTS
jgi:hypothetical protein